MSNFQLLQVVDRGSEAQPEVVENINISTYRDKGENTITAGNFDFVSSQTKTR